MAEPILTVEELDTMWPTDATSESDYEAHLTREETLTRLRLEIERRRRDNEDDDEEPPAAPVRVPRP